MKTCDKCSYVFDEHQQTCPQCGAQPKRLNEGRGFEFRSHCQINGIPLIHVSFKYNKRRPVMAKGILAIGQFACGVVTVSQFGVGMFSISQFTIAGFAVAQFGVAYDLIAQFGIYINSGYGQFIYKAMNFL